MLDERIENMMADQVIFSEQRNSRDAVKVLAFRFMQDYGLEGNEATVRAKAAIKRVIG